MSLLTRILNWANLMQFMLPIGQRNKPAWTAWLEVIMLPFKNYNQQLVDLRKSTLTNAGGAPQRIVLEYLLNRQFPGNNGDHITVLLDSSRPLEYTIAEQKFQNNVTPAFAYKGVYANSLDSANDQYIYSGKYINSDIWTDFTVNVPYSCWNSVSFAGLVFNAFINKNKTYASTYTLNLN